MLVLDGRGTRCVAEVAGELAECWEVLAEELSLELALDKAGRRASRLSEVGAAGSRSGSGHSSCSRPPPHLVTHPGPAPPSPLASRR